MSVEQLRDYSDFLLADQLTEMPNHELAKIWDRLGLLELTNIFFRFDVDPRIFSLRGRVEQLITPQLIRFGNINAALREMNQQYSQFDKVSESSDPGNRAKNLDTYVALQKIPLKGLSGIRSFLRAVIGGAETRGKMAAQLIASERLSPLAYLEHKNLKCNVAQSLIITSIAIELFRHENGEYPPSLDLITSIDIDQFSRDWFADGKFVYHKTNTGFLLYSIGPNGVDDGGLNWMTYPGVVRVDDLRILVGEMPNRK